MSDEGKYVHYFRLYARTAMPKPVREYRLLKHGQANTTPLPEDQLQQLLERYYPKLVEWSAVLT